MAPVSWMKPSSPSRSCMALAAASLTRCSRSSARVNSMTARSVAGTPSDRFSFIAAIVLSGTLRCRRAARPAQPLARDPTRPTGRRGGGRRGCDARRRRGGRPDRAARCGAMTAMLRTARVRREGRRGAILGLAVASLIALALVSGATSTPVSVAPASSAAAVQVGTESSSTFCAGLENSPGVVRSTVAIADVAADLARSRRPPRTSLGLRSRSG